MVMVVLGLQLSLAHHLWAFAVGEMTVYSHRGEPFVAEVHLLLGPRERNKAVEVSVGNQEVYRAEGLRRAAFIDTLKAAMAPGAPDMIRLSSTVPIQESVFDLVLSVRAEQVTIVKHYDVTLPPPAPAVPHVVAQLPTVAQVTALTQAPKTLTKPARPPRRTQRYGPVEKGESLYTIAKALHVPNEKVWQAVVALWRANQGQFFAGNLHGLQVGTFLEVPSDLMESVAAMSLAAAQEVVASQWEEWHTPRHMGTGKQHLIVARDIATSTPTPSKRPGVATASGKRPVNLGHSADAVAAERADTIAPEAQSVETSAAPQEAVLPAGKQSNLVSMTELQTVLQGLEERLMQRLTPPAPVQEVKSAPTFVSTTELQASIQSLEERLTQRMQHMVIETPTPAPVRVGQRPLQQTPAVEAVQPASMPLVPYLLGLTHALCLLIVGALGWLWWRHRDRTERLQRL